MDYSQLSIEQRQQKIDYQIKYGVFLLNTDKKEEAYMIFNDALKLNPTIKEIHLNLGYIALLNADFEKANSNLKKAIALDPNYLLAYENLILLAQVQNNMTDMKGYLNKILEIAPNHKAKQILQKL